MKATFAKHEDGMSWIPGARIFTGASIPGRNDRVQFALVGAVITGLLALLYVPLYPIGVVA